MVGNRFWHYFWLVPLPCTFMSTPALLCITLTLSQGIFSRPCDESEFDIRRPCRTIYPCWTYSRRFGRRVVIVQRNRALVSTLMLHSFRNINYPQIHIRLYKARIKVQSSMCCSASAGLTRLGFFIRSRIFSTLQGTIFIGLSLGPWVRLFRNAFPYIIAES